MRAKGLKQSKLIRRGESLAIPESLKLYKLPEAKTLTPEESKNLQTIQKKLQAISAGRSMLDESLRFNSTETLRTHYGSLHRVILKDERDLTGYAVKYKDHIKIHSATGGVMRLENKDVKRVETIK